MRRFHSYGPVDEKRHFAVPRKDLVKSCVENLIDDLKEGGHYFTIWAPRQTGKTWLMRQAVREIEAVYGNQFAVHTCSLGRLRGMVYKPENSDYPQLPQGLADVLEDELPGKPCLKTWKDFSRIFSKEDGIWDRPLILLIDEVDTSPGLLLDLMVNQFREMYLKREANLLHGLALIGVRAVLGMESDRGSPFNIQRSLRVPNFTREEVEDLFGQYRSESGQAVDPEVVHQVFDFTRGQPGLVGWFGELLTEKYNPGRENLIDLPYWKLVYHKACHSEWNNTILNLIKKVHGPYQSKVSELFSRSDMLFSLDADWCAYLYLNGIITPETMADEHQQFREICRFSSPFMQHRLYNALTLELVGGRLPILALEPTDRITDLFAGSEPDLPGVMERYKSYLTRLKAKGLNPWKDQPRRTDMHLSEAVGHFHLYAWLKEALDGICTVSPEFPTGNGKVDLHIGCGSVSGIIEVKSFRSLVKTEEAKQQAAAYAKSLCLTQVMIALFVPVEDEKILRELSGETVIDGVKVIVSAIAWL